MKNLEELFNVYSQLPSFLGTTLCDVNQRGNFNETPLHIATVRGDIDEIKLLIKNGADINAQGENGYTPIHEAIEQQNSEVSKYLIDIGANCHIKNNDGYTALEFAEILQVDIN